jgi:hypothetical protein
VRAMSAPPPSFPPSSLLFFTDPVT